MENRQVELLSNIVELLKKGQEQTRRSSGSLGSFSADDLSKISTVLRQASDSAKEAKEEIKDIPNVVKDASQQMKDYGKALGAVKVASQQIDKFSGGMLGKLFDATGLNKITGSVFNIAKGFREWRKALKDANGAGQSLLVALDGMTSIVGGLVKSVTGFIGSALKGVAAIGTGITKFIVGSLSSVLTVTAKISKFLVTLPVGIANRASELGNKLRQELVEVIGQAAEDTKEYFDLLSNGGSAMTQLRSIAENSLLTFQSVDSNLTKLFGFGSGASAKMISEVTKGIVDMGIFADVFANSTTKSAESIEFFTRMTRGMGMASDDIAYVMRDAIKNGEHYFDTMTRMKEASDEASYEFGVNRKILSKNFFQLRKDIVNFGHLSEVELMRVTAKATQMGVEIKDLAGIFNKFGTFEDAANSAALLSQTFGMNIDALQLIRAEDPMEIVEMFRNSMLATGRSFEDLSRHEKSLMASHTGMSVETLKTVMNYRTLGRSFEEIKKIMDDQKPEERQIKAMNAMASSMSEVQKIMQKKDFFSSFLDGLSNTIMYGTNLGKSFANLSKNMQNFYETGLQVDKSALNKILDPFAEVIDEINNAFSATSLKGLSGEITQNLGDFVTDILKWNQCITPEAWRETQNDWDNRISGLFSLENLTKSQGFLGKLTRASGKLIGYVIKAFALAGPGIIKGFGKAFESLVDWLAGGKISDMISIDTLAQFLGMGEKECEELIRRVTASFDSIKDYLFGYEASDKMGPKVFGLFDRLGNKFRSIFKLDDDKSMFTSLKESLLDSIKDISESKVFKDSFSTIGEYIVKGMSKATKEIGKLVDTMMNAIQNWLVKNKYISKPEVSFEEGSIGKDKGFKGAAKTQDRTSAELALQVASGEKSVTEAARESLLRDPTDVQTESQNAFTSTERVKSSLAQGGRKAATKVLRPAVAIAGKVPTGFGWLLKGVAKSPIFGGVASTAIEAFLATSNIQDTATYIEHLVNQGVITKEQGKKVFDEAVSDQWTNSGIATVATGAGALVSTGSGPAGWLLSGGIMSLANYVGGVAADLAGYETAQKSMHTSFKKMSSQKGNEDLMKKLELAGQIYERQVNAYDLNEKLAEVEGVSMFTPTGKAAHLRNMSGMYNRQARLRIREGRQLQEVMNLGGESNQPDKDDIDILVTQAKEGNEKSKELLEYFKKFLQEQTNNNNIIVTMDGYALTSHITDIQTRQNNNAALITGTSKNTAASQTQTLNPTQ